MTTYEAPKEISRRIDVDAEDINREVEEQVNNYLYPKDAHQCLEIVEKSPRKPDEYKHLLKDPQEISDIIKNITYSVLVKDTLDELDEL